MTTPDSRRPIPDELTQLFAPVHKLALGVAVGVTTGLLVFAVTAFHVVAAPVDGPPLYLLSQYFYGYTVTWGGAAIGLWWGFVTGFVAGWFVAFMRNLVLAIWLFVLQTRAEAAQTRDFLDHI
jgi:hypothetical protein